MILYLLNLIQSKALVAVPLIAIATCAVLAAPSTKWEERAPLPESNGGFIAGSVGGEIVLLGGTNWQDGTKHWLTGIRRYDPTRNQWRDAGKLEAPLAYAANGGDGNTLWYASGTSGTATHLSLWQVQKAGAPREVAKLPEGIVYAGAAVIGSKLYVLGGAEDQAKLETLSPRFRAIDVKTGQMTKLPDYPETGFFVGATAAVGERFYAFGGARFDPSKENKVTNLSAAHVYSIKSGKWSALPPLSARNRGITAVQLDDTHLYLAGGYRDNPEGFTVDAYIFDTRANTYRPGLPLPYSAMVGLVKVGEWVYCMGGEDRMKHRSDKVFRMRARDLLQAGR